MLDVLITTLAGMVRVFIALLFATETLVEVVQRMMNEKQESGLSVSGTAKHVVCRNSFFGTMLKTAMMAQTFVSPSTFLTTMEGKTKE